LRTLRRMFGIAQTMHIVPVSISLPFIREFACAMSSVESIAIPIGSITLNTR
jgi:hypothetical protein